MPDPVALPEAYEGVLWRRTLAYFVDLCVIGVIAVFCWIVFAVLWLLSFGLLGPILWFSFRIDPARLSYLVAERSAVGHRRHAALRSRASLGDRRAPRLLASVDTDCALFYITVGSTCSLILLLVLFNRHKRTLHDMLAGTVMVRRFPVRWATAQHPVARLIRGRFPPVYEPAPKRAQTRLR